MDLKLIVSNAILGTLTLSLAGYAQSNIETNSQHLSDIEAQTCPVFLDDGSVSDTSNTNKPVAVSGSSNEVLDLTLLCHNGPSTVADSERLNTDINNRPAQTPQSATEFDQLPQDRVEFGTPF